MANNLTDLYIGGHTHTLYPIPTTGIDINLSGSFISNGGLYYESEKNNTKVIQYLLPGFNEGNLEVKKKWVNKTEKLSIEVTGKYEDKNTNYKREVNISIPVDCKIYNDATYIIDDGILTVTLYEIIHEEPRFYLSNIS